MNQYLILTEYLPQYYTAVCTRISQDFNAYTVYFGVGFWASQKENNLSILIIADDLPKTIKDIHQLCRDLVNINHQQAVMLSVTPTTTRLFEK